MPIAKFSLAAITLTLSMCVSAPEEPITIQISEQSLPQLLKISGTDIFTGGQPRGEAAFAYLAKLGVKTVVNVDGAQPSIEEASKFGLRYVHIPINYDGIDEIASASLQKVAEECEFPIYVHCHHGKHRGPAAAALIARAHDEFSASKATQIMVDAGTSSNYPGLWKDIQHWQVMKNISWADPLVELAVIEDFTSGMAELDRVWDRLKLIQKSEWRAPADHPDLVPNLEAEYFEELLFDSLHSANREFTESSEFNQLGLDSINASQNLTEAIKSGDFEAAEVSFSRVGKACKSCHSNYRN